MVIPGFALQHARTVASCASSSVKSHVSSNKATPRKGRVVPSLLRPGSRIAILTEDFDSGTFHRYSFRWPGTRRGTDFDGWESSTTQLETLQECERLCHLFSRFHFLSRHESKSRNLVLRPLSGFIKQLETDLLVHAPQLPRYLVAPNVNHVRVGTLEAPSGLQVEHRTRPG